MNASEGSNTNEAEGTMAAQELAAAAAILSSASHQAEVIEYLAAPGTLGSAVPEMVQTHGSVVFLVGDRAFKLKRAVRYSYLDYSTPAKRRAACEAEYRINQRFAPTLYLGVQPVLRGADGRFSLDGTGEPVDWLVVMRRFDAAAQLDHVVEKGALSRDLLIALADRLAALHGEAPVSTGHGGAAGLSHVLAGVLGNLRTDALLPTDDLEDWARRVGAAMDMATSLLEKRRQAGKVRACHGDLHLRNICLLDGLPTPFDGIEFDPEISTIDVLYDLAFLLMDLVGRGLEKAANTVMNRYLDRSGDDEGLAVLPLFMSLRAAIRAQVTTTAAQGLRQDGAAQAMLAEAASYLRLALRLLDPVPPRLVAIGGLSGTGKSTLAYALAPGLGRPPGARVLRSDVIRKRLHGLPPEARLPLIAYAPAASAEVYAHLAETAMLCLAAGQATVADAVFLHPAERGAIAAVGRSAGLRCEGLWLTAPAEQLVARVSMRRADVSDATADVVRAQSTQAGAPPAEWTVIDASGGPIETCQRAISMLNPAQPLARLREDCATKGEPAD